MVSGVPLPDPLTYLVTEQGRGFFRRTFIAYDVDHDIYTLQRS